MYSAITYLVSFVVMGVLFIFWGAYIWTWATPTNINPAVNTAPANALFGWVVFATMLAITLVVLSRQGENFRKIKTGEAKKMKLWKIFKGKADEALK